MKTPDNDAKILTLLAMSRKAGKLLLGFESVREGMERGKVFLSLVTADASEKTKKEVEFFSIKYNVPFLRAKARKEEIKRFTGREAAVMGIADPNLANGIVSLSDYNGNT